MSLPMTRLIPSPPHTLCMSRSEGVWMFLHSLWRGLRFCKITSSCDCAFLSSSLLSVSSSRRPAKAITWFWAGGLCLYGHPISSQWLHLCCQRLLKQPSGMLNLSCCMQSEWRSWCISVAHSMAIKKEVNSSDFFIQSNRHLTLGNGDESRFSLHLFVIQIIKTKTWTSLNFKNSFKTDLISPLFFQLSPTAL